MLSLFRFGLSVSKQGKLFQLRVSLKYIRLHLSENDVETNAYFNLAKVRINIMRSIENIHIVS